MRAARPFFSIVIPLYNKQEHIANTLQSVLHQTFPDYELLVINDGSTDQSATIAGLFHDHRLQVFHQKNAGVSAARNHGIKRAKGRYLAFLDADDLWEPQYLAEMRKLLLTYPGCGFYGAAHTVLENHRTFIEGGTMPEGIVEDYFRCEWTHHITRLSATIVDPVVFEKIKGFPEGMISGEDNFFCASIAREFPVAYTPKPLVIYNKKFSGLPQRFAKMDSCRECWLDLYADGDFYRNELIAGKALKAGIRYALSFNRVKSLKMETDFSYTRLSANKWRILFLLNRLPDPGIKLVIQLIFLKNMLRNFYQQVAAKKPVLARQPRPPRKSFFRVPFSPGPLLKI
ncbi:glycosyltransferase family 2 protein [Adhaeribacter sp. BT258]|uniref:Glycosyltransferase family 2 protein n=1 Tax=Adhaeribacter terrigena TaxID=2793070 RepID=A0ABS1BXP8_9BACT|nr:glycosyltransferase family A protein [Adhaeribacter terrigena]MBK0401920.1 glycosyltransferase family 2 protein [Adhaeribacter terrigena]